MTPSLSGTAFLFPGQGSQAVGMGQDLVKEYQTARSLFQQADDVLGFSLSKNCFEGPEDTLKQTENTQPALYLVSCATLEALRQEGISDPEFVAGHSLGEYSALYAAGVVDFATGLRLVRARGEAMRDAGKLRRGAMAAVLGLDGDRVAALCAEASSGACVAVAANFNAPDQTVISGDAEAVDKASAAIKAAGAKRVLPLPVSGAFHSPLVQAAADAMKQNLAGVTLRAPRLKFINNADAQFLTTSEAIRESLVRQVISPVRWVETIHRLRDSGARRYIEVGSGKVLSGLVKRIHKEADALTTDTVDAVKATVAALRAG